MYTVDLIQLIVAREKGEQSQDLEDNAADAPQVHLVAVVAIGQ